MSPDTCIIGLKSTSEIDDKATFQGIVEFTLPILIQTDVDHIKDFERKRSTFREVTFKKIIK